MTAEERLEGEEGGEAKRRRGNGEMRNTGGGGEMERGARGQEVGGGGREAAKQRGLEDERRRSGRREVFLAGE